MRSQITLLLAALVLVLGACDNTGTGDASLRVLLTDAPGDFLSAVVTIEQVYLQSGNGDDDPEGGRTILSDDPVTVDLLTLQNEVLALVDDETVPEGTYHQLRLVISGGYIEVENDDGTSSIYASSDAYASEQNVDADGRLQMPSYSSSGLKITLPSEAAQIEGDQNIVLIDFNVSESFGHQAGNSGMWVMHPVVHATDLAFTGGAEISLALADGVVLPDGFTLGDFAAELDKSGDLLSMPFADADDDGVFSTSFLYLAPDSYPVDLVVPDGLSVTTDVALPADVSISSGANSGLDVMINSAEAL